MRTLIWLLMLLPLVSWGQVYKCTDEQGRTVYSQVQCGHDAVAVHPGPNAQRSSGSGQSGPGDMPPTMQRSNLRSPQKKTSVDIFCADKWPGDFRMQRYCVDQQNKAAADLRGFIERAAVPGSVEQLILGRCGSKWKVSEGVYDWRMVKYCTDQQINAYRSLNR